MSFVRLRKKGHFYCIWGEKCNFWKKGGGAKISILGIIYTPANSTWHPARMFRGEIVCKSCRKSRAMSHWSATHFHEGKTCHVWIYYIKVKSCYKVILHFQKSHIYSIQNIYEFGSVGTSLCPDWMFWVIETFHCFIVVTC